MLKGEEAMGGRVGMMPLTSPVKFCEVSIKGSSSSRGITRGSNLRWEAPTWEASRGRGPSIRRTISEAPTWEVSKISKGVGFARPLPSTHPIWEE